MKKFLYMIPYIISFAIIAWVFLSFMEVIIFNLEPEHIYSSWNYFGLGLR